MNKLFLLMLIMAFPMVASPQGYVNNFKWEENEGTYNGYPLVTIAVGDKHQLQYSYTTNTLGTDIFNVNSGNWVFYENNTVVNAPTVFSMNAQGVVTGVKEGLGALKPTGLILKASGTDRLYIKVVSSYEEQEPNNDFNSANELKGAPTTFGLYNLSDIDYFKVKANAGDKITFKIKGDNSNNKFFGFKWSKFSSTYQSLGSGSLAIDESTGERDIEISSAFTSNYGTGYYYLEIYYDQSRSQYFTYDKLTVQAFLNDKPVGYDETEPDPEPVYDVKFSYDDSNMTATVIAGDNKYTGNIVIPENVIHNGKTYKVTRIGDNAFFGCSGLTSVTIGNSVTSIGGQAFYGCSGLTNVTIGNSVTSIKYSAFLDCSSLTSVTIPNSVTFIGSCAFLGCSGLTSVTIGNSVTNIESQAFLDCSSLTSVTIPNSVTSIEYGTFLGCSGLTSVTIPNSVTSIGGSAFSGCSGLTSVTVPNSVTSIGDYAFGSCSDLTSIKVEPGNTKYDSRNNCNAIIETSTNTLISGCKNTTIPNSVTSIGESAFSGCSGLTSITIPNSVTSIGIHAFDKCTSLTSVTVKMKTPVNISSYTFSNRENATLYVPYGCKSAYMAANFWKQFKKIVEVENVVDVTDISQMNNAIYVKTASGRVGDDVSIEVCMKNANAATSYGFELVLPQGLSIATTSDGDFDGAVTKSTRHNGHTLTTNKVANNTYKVAVISLSSKALTGNDGLVLTIKAHVADNMALGDHPIIIQNPLIVNTDGTKPAIQSTQSKITIEDYIKGDVDGDGVIDLADAVLIINYYVGKPVSKFVEKAADVDGDGEVDVADAVRIVNYVVGKISALAPRFEWNLPEPE